MKDRKADMVSAISILFLYFFVVNLNVLLSVNEISSVNIIKSFVAKRYSLKANSFKLIGKFRRGDCTVP